MDRRAFNFLQRSVISSTSKSKISHFVVFSAVQIKHWDLQQAKLSNVFIINIKEKLEFSGCGCYLVVFLIFVSLNMLQDVLN